MGCVGGGAAKGREGRFGGVKKWREEGAAIDCGENGGKTMTGERHVAVIRNSRPSALGGGQYSFKHDSKK